MQVSAPQRGEGGEKETSIAEKVAENEGKRSSHTSQRRPVTAMGAWRSFRGGKGTPVSARAGREGGRRRKEGKHTRGERNKNGGDGVRTTGGGSTHAEGGSGAESAADTRAAHEEERRGEGSKHANAGEGKEARTKHTQEECGRHTHTHA